MVGFFDDYKLKTEADRKKDQDFVQDLEAKGTVVDDNATGHSTQELVNLDAGVKTGKHAQRILKSVMRVKNSGNETD